MDSQQFAQFLSVQKEQQNTLNIILQQLLQQQKTTLPSSSTPNNEILTLLKNFKIETFNASTSRIEEYIDFFETKCKIYNVGEKFQKDLILSSLTPETFQELKIALTPTFDASTYSEIRSKLLDLYRIKKTRYRALTEFWNSIREPNETMEHYANRLKNLCKDCGYKDSLLERQLRDRFATGLNHVQLETDLKQKWPDLLETIDTKTNEVTFSQIFAVAQSREQAEHDNALPSIMNVNKIKRKITKNNFKSESSRGMNATQFKSEQPRKMNPKQCFRCGEQGVRSFNDHIIQCPARKHTCRACNTDGHYETYCLKTGKAVINNRKTKLQKIHIEDTTDTEDDDENGEEYVYNIPTKTGNKYCKRIDVSINGIRCTMDWDPGSTYSIISTKLWREIGSPPLCQGPKLKAYGSHNLKSKGLTEVEVEVDGTTKILPAVVIHRAKPMLFGLQWSEIFNMSFPKQVYSIRHSDNKSLDEVLNCYKTLFDGKLGKVNNYKVNIYLKEGVKPVHIPARPIKFSMRKNIELEINRLVSDGIITQVDPNCTPIEWATPTVNVVKPNGQIRICGDYRSTINPVLIKHLHPVPVFDRLRQILANGQLFSKIDLKDAYLQFEIAPDSKKFLTLSTHKGYYQYNRMPFGISTAPSVFQHYLDNLLTDLPNVAVYFDDIAITGKNLHEHLSNLSTVFDRLQKSGLKVNLNKCCFLQKGIKYLGHIIDSNGIRPTADKIEAIKKASEPTNTKELKSFLGLVNFYERFIPNLHGLCADLHSLTSGKKKWRWTNHENNIFESIKSQITSSKPLIAFDDKLPIFLACDASEKGVGAVLYHKIQNIDRPIAFASRKLRPAETKYSVIDREALAILFGITKFDQYLRGTKFTLITDHKPLIYILGTDRNLPKLTNNRLVRWALLIGSYNYEILYKKGANNVMADCLSRLPNEETKPTLTETSIHKIESRLLGTRITDLQLSEQLLKEKTSKDLTLQKVKQFLKTGWRDSEYNNEIKHFHRKRTELSVENGILMWQGRMIIPECLRPKILTYIHRGHPGISAMKALVRFYVWWPAIDEDIDNYVKKCVRCQQNRPNNPELPIFSWSLPEQVWERIHIDFAGPFQGYYWLILCDALSKWIEIRPMKHITTRSLCMKLDDIFCTFGFPSIIVSDNGPQFTSLDFKQYCKEHSILHVTSSPYHPRTNGLAERLVRTFKARMSLDTEGDHKKRLLEFLLTYRNTPHNTTGKSPAQMMFGRQLNCLLANIRPNRRRNFQYNQVQAGIQESDPSFRPGDTVYTRTRQDKVWQPATITARKHRYSYVICTPEGIEKRRHADHIRHRLATDITNSTPGPSHQETAVSLQGGIASATPATSGSSPISSYTTPISCETVPVIDNTGSAEVTPESPSLAVRRTRRTIHPPRRLIEEM